MKQPFLPLLFSVGLVLVMASCQKQDVSLKENPASDVSLKKANTNSKTNTFYGPQVHVGNGKVRSFIEINHNGEPQEIGVEMTDDALTGLPEETVHSDAIVVPLHSKAVALTPFQHIGLNWNPHGHPPPGLFLGIPHFDFHFYMISNEERMSIPAYSEESADMFNNFPAYMPADYFAPPGPDGAEPQMGKHWLPPPPSFLPFTRVMILGTYDGRLIFEEPMVTVDYLESDETTSQPFSQPSWFEHAGKYYPTVMNVYEEEKTGKHIVSLSNFIKR